MRYSKNKPNKLFDDSEDWQWESNLGHWFCTVDGKKALIWCEWLNPPDDKSRKLSKSAGEDKFLWDGICIGVPGGPEPDSKPGPILYWLRKNIRG